MGEVITNEYKDIRGNRCPAKNLVFTDNRSHSGLFKRFDLNILIYYRQISCSPG